MTTRRGRPNIKRGEPMRAGGTYGACSRHMPHTSKAEARRAGQRHTRLVTQGRMFCRSCRRGMVPEAWHCDVAGGHWHWGHSWIAERSSESGQRLGDQ